MGMMVSVELAELVELAVQPMRKPEAVIESME